MKIKRFLGFIALAVAILLPMSANAATIRIPEKYGELPYVKNADGTYTADIPLILVDGTSWTEAIPLQISRINTEIVSVEGVGIWTYSQTGDTIGDTIYLTPTAPETRTGEFVAAKITYKVVDPSVKPCEFAVACNQSKAEVVIKDVENPKTGNVLPYAVIVGGIAIAGAVYYVTRKNNKLYNI